MFRTIFFLIKFHDSTHIIKVQNNLHFSQESGRLVWEERVFLLLQRPAAAGEELPARAGSAEQDEAADKREEEEEEREEDPRLRRWLLMFSQESQAGRTGEESAAAEEGLWELRGGDSINSDSQLSFENADQKEPQECQFHRKSEPFQTNDAAAERLWKQRKFS